MGADGVVGGLPGEQFGDQLGDRDVSAGAVVELLGVTAVATFHPLIVGEWGGRSQFLTARSAGLRRDNALGEGVEQDEGGDEQH
jgi:hypothetical protein